MHKDSLNPSESNIFYKSIIKNTLLFFCALFILSIITVIYLNTAAHSKRLLLKIERVAKYAELEIKNSKTRYTNQINCFKNSLRESKLDNKDLKPLLETCNSLITNKIILDKNKKVIFSDINLDRYSELDLGFSFSELKNIDTENIISKMLQDKSSDKQYFFTASALRDKANNFNGAVILQINTEYLNTILVPQSYRTLSVQDHIKNASKSLYEEMKNTPILSFFEHIILRNSEISIIHYSKELNKYLEFKYTP